MDARIEGFFDPQTHTVSYVLADPATGRCAIIDPVWDYDAASGRTATGTVERIARHVEEHDLRVELILETHAHADHLSASQFLKRRFQAPLAIGAHIVEVQRVFRRVFHIDGDEIDQYAFDRLLQDGETFTVGDLELRAMHTPGHTPACMAYVGDGYAFVGDTLFMPDYGTARTDFPGGDARTLYRSIQRLYALPEETRLYLCHDYLPDAGRDEFRWVTTVAEERRHNIHVHDGIDEDAFVRMREARDAGLALPKLLVPSVQVNIRGGHLPAPESNGVSYIKVPVDQL
ncbi:MAG: MBL fold metallo-hydrolase [Pseudomonadales bacterium]|jgi:glyoxylase-like metal-dependent hydrolase (beta-lactamase superfamily II)|nr:MBL fold metallo-hydrolase [Pseudomonadales bacterium]